MLDDDAGRRVELTHALERGVAVRDVVVRQLLALQLRRRGHRCADRARIAVERRLLVRVLAVAQIEVLAKRQIQIVRERSSVPPPIAPVKYADTMASYCAVWANALAASLLAHAQCGCALIGREFIEQRAVVRGIDDHRDRRVILGRRAHHGGSADVDVLDRLVVAAVGSRHGRGERVEVDRRANRSARCRARASPRRRCRGDRAVRHESSDAAS